MAIAISLINMKGGVGKSTLTVNLAWQFAAYSNWLKRVLVVDLDPQFNASQYLLGVSRYEKVLQDGNPTVWDVFEQNTRTPLGRRGPFDAHEAIRVVSTIGGKGRVDLIPSRLELAYSLRNPSQKESFLTKALTQVEDEYDLILIDCAPTDSVLTTAAYLASDYVLVPVKAEFLSSIGLPLLVSSMEDFQEQHEEHDLELAGIVFNSTSNYAPEEYHSKSEVRKLAEKHNWYVFANEVPFSRSFPKGAREGRPIFRTSYARAEPARKVNAFARELADRVGL